MAVHAHSTTAPARPLLPLRGPGGRFASRAEFHGEVAKPEPAPTPLLPADRPDHSGPVSASATAPNSGDSPDALIAEAKCNTVLNIDTGPVPANDTPPPHGGAMVSATVAQSLDVIPAPLPPLTAALSRRRAIFGAITVDNVHGDGRSDGTAQGKDRTVDNIHGDKGGASVARRKELYEILHPETANGGDRRSSDRQFGELKSDRFTADTAAHTGRPERSIQRDAARGTDTVRTLSAVDEPDTAAEARAIHARREMHGALEWGFAFLDALDLGPAALDVIDGAIARMDDRDAADEDREPYLAGWYNGGVDPTGEAEGVDEDGDDLDRGEHDTSDDEAWLGWPEDVRAEAHPLAALSEIDAEHDPVDLGAQRMPWRDGATAAAEVAYA